MESTVRVKLLSKIVNEECTKKGARYLCIKYHTFPNERCAEEGPEGDEKVAASDSG